MQTNAHRFRTRSSYVWFGVTMALVVLMATEAILVGGSALARVGNSAMALSVGLAAYLLFFRPMIVIFDEGITIVNPMTTETIGWAEVEAIETKFTLSVLREGRVVHAWAAPAPGRHHRRLIDPTEMRGVGHSGHAVIRPGDDPESISGSAAAIARLRWLSFQHSGTKSAPYHHRRDYRLVAALALCACAAVLAR